MASSGNVTDEAIKTYIESQEVASQDANFKVSEGLAWRLGL